MSDRPPFKKRDRSKRKGGHDPSGYRAIIREAKKGGKGSDISALLREAKRLTDSYYVALSLVSLSSHPKLSLDRATSTAEQGIGNAGKENRGWRKAELLVDIHRKLVSWRMELNEGGADDIRHYLREKVFDQVRKIQVGSARSEAIQGLAAKSDPGQTVDLLNLALDNKGSILEDARVVIRSWVRSISGSPNVQEKLDSEYPNLVTTLKATPDTSNRSRLFGYLLFQLKKEKLFPNAISAFEHALEQTDSIGDANERLEALRYLISVVDSTEEFAAIKERLESFEDPGLVVRGLATLSGRMDKCGFTDEASKHLLLGLEKVKLIPGADERALARLNIAKGLYLCGLPEAARSALTESLHDCKTSVDPEQRMRVESRVVSGMKKLGFADDDPIFDDFHTRKEHESAHSHGNLPNPDEGIHRNENDAAGCHGKATCKNHVLALYDAYEGGLKPTHLRAVARAAPLCAAFDLDLALIGFPTNDLDRIVRETIAETNIGHGGDLLLKLAQEERITLVPASSHEPPGDLDRLGIPVATSSHPDPMKLVNFHELNRLIEKGNESKVRWEKKKDSISGSDDEKKAKSGSERSTSSEAVSKNGLCLIMGLGRKGLPLSLLKSVPYHLELTGRNIPLETSTVMGIIAERLRALNPKD